MELPALFGLGELVAIGVGEVVVAGADEDEVVDVGAAIGGWGVGDDVMGLAVAG